MLQQSTQQPQRQHSSTKQWTASSSTARTLWSIPRRFISRLRMIPVFLLWTWRSFKNMACSLMEARHIRLILDKCYFGAGSSQSRTIYTAPHSRAWSAPRSSDPGFQILGSSAPLLLHLRGLCWDSRGLTSQQRGLNPQRRDSSLLSTGSDTKLNKSAEQRSNSHQIYPINQENDYIYSLIHKQRFPIRMDLLTAVEDTQEPLL